MIKPACPVADVPELVNTRLKRYYSECTAWRREMLQRIVAMRPTAVVLSSFDHYVTATDRARTGKSPPSSGATGLRRTYGRSARAGISSVAIRGTPNAGFDVPSCLSRRASGAPFSDKPCAYDFAGSLVPSAVAAQNEAARGVSTLAFVDMNDRILRARRVRGRSRTESSSSATATTSRRPSAGAKRPCSASASMLR